MPGGVSRGEDLRILAASVAEVTKSHWTPHEILSGSMAGAFGAFMVYLRLGHKISIQSSEKDYRRLPAIARA
jgi:hypothetical protein